MRRIFLLMTNCCSIEEKIYQRQMMKGEIAATVEDNVENGMKCKGGRYFSREELRELFTLNMVRLMGNKTFLFCWFLVFGFGFLLISGINSDVVSALGRKLCVKHMIYCVVVVCLLKSSGEIALSNWKTLHSGRQSRVALFPLSRKRFISTNKIPN